MFNLNLNFTTTFIKSTDLRGPRLSKIATESVLCKASGKSSTWFPLEGLVEQKCESLNHESVHLLVYLRM